MADLPIQHAGVPLSQPIVSGTAGQLPTTRGMTSLKALARVVLARDGATGPCRDATPQRGIPARTNEPTPQPGSANTAEPILLRDGRRLRRFAAAAIIEDISGQVRALMQTARGYGAGLWADGCELIVVEQWGHLLPDAVFEQLRRYAGVVIAELRGGSHARGEWQVFDPPGAGNRPDDGSGVTSV